MKAIKVRFEGLRPIMFDRYAGDNNTKLPVEEKLYLDDDGGLVIPSINIFSLICSENSASVIKQGYFGKDGKKIAKYVAGFMSIDQADIPLLDGKGNQIKWEAKWTDQIFVHEAVARVKNGIPNPKRRPTVKTPWALEFSIKYLASKDYPLKLLQNAFEYGGELGLGTFRPFFGRYEMTKFEEV